MEHGGCVGSRRRIGRGGRGIDSRPRVLHQWSKVYPHMYIFYRWRRERRGPRASLLVNRRPNKKENIVPWYV